MLVYSLVVDPINTDDTPSEVTILFWPRSLLSAGEQTAQPPLKPSSRLDGGNPSDLSFLTYPYPK